MTKGTVRTKEDIFDLMAEGRSRHGQSLTDAMWEAANEIERLRAALEPIAAMGVATHEKLSTLADHNVPFYDCPADLILYHDRMGHPLTVGMVRAAKRALTQS